MTTAPADTSKSARFFLPPVRTNFSGSSSELANRFTGRTVDQLTRPNMRLQK
jgi:hypothetical protein